jgi:hypothetical protein
MGADLGAADLGAADLGAADLGTADMGTADMGTADMGTDMGNDMSPASARRRGPVRVRGPARSGPATVLRARAAPPRVPCGQDLPPSRSGHRALLTGPPPARR